MRAVRIFFLVVVAAGASGGRPPGDRARRAPHPAAAPATRTHRARGAGRSAGRGGRARLVRRHPQRRRPLQPVDLVRLTGAYLGAWCSFLALLCGWSAARGSWDEARLTLVTLAAAGAGAAVGLARSYGDVRHPGASLVAALGMVTLAAVLYAVGQRGSVAQPR